MATRSILHLTSTPWGCTEANGHRVLQLST